MAVIQPYMQPREYSGLDTFTNYWAAYTGARSAKWQQRMELVLRQMDNSQTGELISDLRSRRDDLVREQRRLRRGQIETVETQERDIRRQSSGTRTTRANINSYASQIGSYERYNADRRRAYTGDVAAEDLRLREEEREDRDESQEFLGMMGDSTFAHGAGYDAQQRPHAATDIYSQYAQALRDRETGTSDAAVRRRHAHALALYMAALEQGHPEAAAAVQRIHPELGSGQAGASNLADRYITTTEEMAERREARLDAIAPAAYVDTDRIYEKAREQHAVDHPEDFEAGGSTSGTSGAASSVLPGGEGSYAMYGAEQLLIAGEIQALDAQIMALTAARSAEQQAGMNALQGMMSMNWNFAPYALSRDDSSQDFIEQVEEYDPLRVGTYIENLGFHGGQRGLRRAQIAGEVDPYDPITSTTVDEYSSANQGAFIFGYMHDQVQGVEQLLSQGTSAVPEAFGRMMMISSNAERITSLSLHAEHFLSRFEPLYRSIEGYRVSESAGGQGGMAHALGKMYMALGYHEMIQGDYHYRRYGDGKYGRSVSGEPGSFVFVVETDLPTAVSDSFNAIPLPTNPNTAEFHGFENERDDLPVSMEIVLEELAESRELARAEMGDGDVLFGQLLSSTLNDEMSLPRTNQSETDVFLRRIHATAEIVDDLPRDLVGDRSNQLSRSLELRSAQGDFSGMLMDLDRMIQGGQDESVIESRFADYMQEYGTIAEGTTSERRTDDAGNVYEVRTPVTITSDEPLPEVDEATGRDISAAFGEPTDVGRGVIQPGPDVIGLAGPPTDATRPGPVGTAIPIYSYEGGPYVEGTRSDPAELIARFEAQEERARALEQIRQRAVDPGTTGYTDPALQRSLRQPTVYELSADQQEEHERLSEEYDSINERMRTSPGVSRAEAMLYGGITEADLDRRSEILDRLMELETMRRRPQEPMGSVLSADERRATEWRGAVSEMQDLPTMESAYDGEERVVPPAPSEPLLASMRSIPYLVGISEEYDRDYKGYPLVRGRAQRLQGSVERMQSATEPAEIVGYMHEADLILQDQLEVSQEFLDETQDALDAQREMGPQDGLVAYVENMKQTIRENAGANPWGVDPETGWDSRQTGESLDELVRGRIVAEAIRRGHIEEGGTFRNVQEMAVGAHPEYQQRRLEELQSDLEHYQGAVDAIEFDMSQIRDYPVTQGIGNDELERLLGAIRNVESVAP